MTQSRRDRWNARYAGRELVWSARPNQALVDVLDELALPPGRALDVGCGEGRNAIWLAEQGWQTTAADFSDVAIDKARRLAENRGVRVDWHVADVTTWAPPSASFELAIALFLQTDSAERAGWLGHMTTALMRGGTLIYLGHDLSNLRDGHGGPQSAAVLATPSDIVAALPGFEVVRAEVLRRPVASEPEHGGGAGAVALDTLVVATKDQDHNDRRRHRGANAGRG